MDQGSHLGQKVPSSENVVWDREFAVQLKRARLTVGLLTAIQEQIKERLGRDVMIEYIYEDPLPRANAAQEAAARKTKGIFPFPGGRTYSDGDEIKRCTSNNLDDIISTVNGEKRLNRIKVRYVSDDHIIELQLGGNRKYDRGHLRLHCIWSGADPSSSVRWIWELILRRNHLWLTYKAFVSLTIALVVFYSASLLAVAAPVQSWWARCLAANADYGKLANEAVGAVIGIGLALFLLFRLWDRTTRGRLTIRSYDLTPRVRSAIEHGLQLIGVFLPDRWARRAAESVEAEAGIVAIIVAVVALWIALLAWLLPM